MRAERVLAVVKLAMYYCGGSCWTAVPTVTFCSCKQDRKIYHITNELYHKYDICQTRFFSRKSRRLRTHISAIFAVKKRVQVNPDIFYFDNWSSAPVFDLLLGTETMERLGIVLSFKTIQSHYTG